MMTIRKNFGCDRIEKFESEVHELFDTPPTALQFTEV